MQASLPKPIIPPPTTTQRLTLEQWLTEAIVDQSRLTATYQNQVFLVAVPLTDVELIKQLKNALDSGEEDGNVTQIEIFPNRKNATIILKKLFDHVEDTKDCLTLTYLKKLFVIVVPKEKEELMEEIEDWIDNADADDARKEGGVPIPWEQIEKELGLG